MGWEYDKTLLRASFADQLHIPEQLCSAKLVLLFCIRCCRRRNVLAFVSDNLCASKNHLLTYLLIYLIALTDFVYVLDVCAPKRGPSATGLIKNILTNSPLKTLRALKCDDFYSAIAIIHEASSFDGRCKWNLIPLVEIQSFSETRSSATPGDKLKPITYSKESHIIC